MSGVYLVGTSRRPPRKGACGVANALRRQRPQLRTRQGIKCSPQLCQVVVQGEGQTRARVRRPIRGLQHFPGGWLPQVLGLPERSHCNI